MNGIDEESNLVNLTAREHYIAHLLLWKIYSNTQYEFSLLYAFIKMSISTNKQKRQIRINSKLYEFARKQFAISLSQHWNNLSNDKKKHIKSLISQSVKNNWANMTQKEYEMRCKNISLGKQNAFNSMTLDERMQFSNKLSSSKKGTWQSFSKEKQQRISKKIGDASWNLKSTEEKMRIIEKRNKTNNSKSQEYKNNLRKRRSQIFSGKNNPCYNRKWMYHPTTLDSVFPKENECKKYLDLGYVYGMIKNKKFKT